VDYSGDYPMIPQNRFGQQFVGKVANPHTVLQWFKRKKPTSLCKRTICCDNCVKVVHLNFVKQAKFCYPAIALPTNLIGSHFKMAE